VIRLPHNRKSTHLILCIHLTTADHKMNSFLSVTVACQQHVNTKQKLLCDKL